MPRVGLGNLEYDVVDQMERCPTFGSPYSSSAVLYGVQLTQRKEPTRNTYITSHFDARYSW